MLDRVKCLHYRPSTFINMSKYVISASTISRFARCRSADSNHSPTVYRYLTLSNAEACSS